MIDTLFTYRIKQFSSLNRQNCSKNITQSFSLYDWSISFYLHFLELLGLFRVEVVTRLHLILMDLNLLTVHSIYIQTNLTQIDLLQSSDCYVMMPLLVEMLTV